MTVHVVRFGESVEIDARGALKAEVVRASSWLAYYRRSDPGPVNLVPAEEQRLATAERACRAIGMADDEIAALVAIGATLDPFRSQEP